MTFVDTIRALMTLETDEEIRIYRCPVQRVLRVTVEKKSLKYMYEIPLQAIINDDLEAMRHAIEYSLRTVRRNAKSKDESASGGPVPAARSALCPRCNDRSSRG